MPLYLRQSTASQEIPLGYFVDSTDGNTEETGLTIANTDIKLWKTGTTTLANKNSGGATHISNGLYYCTLDATDTNTIGPMVIFVHVSGALAVRVECCVLDENVYDVQFGTTAPATATNITSASGVAVSSIGANVITATSIATNAITSAKIAADAIGASELAADAVAEIADQVWDELQSGHVTAGSFGEIATEIASILVDTAEIGTAGAGLTEAGGTGDHLTAIPWNAAWDAEVQSEVNDGLVAYDAATGTDVTTAAANVSVDEIQATALADLFNTDSGTTYASAVAGSPVKEIADNAGGSALTEAGIADAVWDELQSGHVTAGSFGEIATEIASILADTNELQTDNIPGTLSTIEGKIDTIDTNVDAVLVDTGTTLPAVLGTPTDFGSGTSTLAANLQDLADNGTATYDRSTDSLQAIRDRGDSAWITATGFSTHSAADVRTEMDANSTQLAAILADTAEIGLAGAGLTNINLPDQTMNITGNLSGSVGSVTGNVGGNVVGSVANVTGGINTAAGTITTLDGLDTAQDTQHSTTQSAISGLNDLSAAQVNAEVDTALADINLDHLVASAVDTNFATTVHLDSVIGQIADTGTTATFDRTTDSQEAIRNRGDSAWTTATGFSTHSAADVWSVATRVLTANTNLNDPTAAAIADAVWEEAIADHSGTSGSTAEALNAAGSAGDPWTTALPGSYTAGQAGYIVGNNLDAPVSTVDTVVDGIKAVTDNLPDSGALSSLATATALATVDTNVDAIKAKTDSLTFTVSNEVDVNVKSANDTTLLGTGTSGDLWRGS